MILDVRHYEEELPNQKEIEVRNLIKEWTENINQSSSK